MKIFTIIFLIPFFSFNTLADVHVKGYFKSNGSYVAPHYRSNPDATPYNNWSTKGNINPYTGKEGYKDPNQDMLKSSSTSYKTEDSFTKNTYIDSELIFDKTNEYQNEHQNKIVNNEQIKNSESIVFQKTKKKLKDINSAEYLKAQDYDFDPKYMNAYTMDRKIEDIKRAEYWKTQGYNFDPKYMNAYTMDNKAQEIKNNKGD